MAEFISRNAVLRALGQVRCDYLPCDGKCRICLLHKAIKEIPVLTHTPKDSCNG